MFSFQPEHLRFDLSCNWNKQLSSSPSSPWISISFTSARVSSLSGWTVNKVLKTVQCWHSWYKGLGVAEQQHRDHSRAPPLAQSVREVVGNDLLVKMGVALSLPRKQQSAQQSGIILGFCAGLQNQDLSGLPFITFQCCHLESWAMDTCILWEIRSRSVEQTVHHLPSKEGLSLPRWGSRCECEEESPSWPSVTHVSAEARRGSSSPPQTPATCRDKPKSHSVDFGDLPHLLGQLVSENLTVTLGFTF